MPAHPAGPLHGDQLHPHAPTPPPVDAAAQAWLDPAVWSEHTARDAAGVLTVAGHGVRDLQETYGTPLLVLDEGDFRARCAAFRDAFRDADVHYAAKAFLTTTVARWVEEEGLGLDVATGGELAVALRAGFPAERIVLHGNNKSVAELAAALDAGVGRVVLDSLVEIDRLARLAADRGVTATCWCASRSGSRRTRTSSSRPRTRTRSSASRWRPAKPRRRSGTSSRGPSCGWPGCTRTSARRSSTPPASRSRPTGWSPWPHRSATSTASRWASSTSAAGCGIAYTSDDDPPDVAAFASALRAIVERECAAYDLPVPRIGVEPGRALVGPSALTLYEVGTVKDVELDGGHHRTYVSVDGGMSDNIRTALYDADYTVTLASRSSSAGPMLARVVGRHCETGDVVVQDAWLPADLAPGDLLAVAATGAYCRAMASGYNMVGRPPVVAVRPGEATVLLRRETIEDLLALDPGA